MSATFVWVMRDKGSEWRALTSLQRLGPLAFTPLIEAVCEPFLVNARNTPKNPVDVIRQLAAKARTVTDRAPAWIDLGNLLNVFSDRDVATFYEILRSEGARDLGLGRHLLVPVVRSTSPEPVLTAAIEWHTRLRSGVCYRIMGPTHADKAGRALAEFALRIGDSSLTLDLVYDAQDLPLVFGHEALADVFPISQKARSWSVISGTFPASITPLSPNDYEHKLERTEWQAWKAEIDRNAGWRPPIYGDYATQPSIYTPSLPYAGSPSVRYTGAEEFVVLRGRGGSRGPGYSQFVGHALFLRDQTYYRNVASTLGDSYVERIAQRDQGTGNLTTWRVASLQRHLQVVASQVRAYTKPFIRHSVSR